MKQFKVTQAEYTVIKSDLSRAKKYLHFLEEEKAKPQSETKGHASVREALSVAAVIAYNRAFTSNHRKAGGKKPWWISPGLVQGLSADMQKLHKEMKEIRDKLWAHTDETSFGGANLIIPLKRAVIPAFEQLIDEVLKRLQVAS